MTNRDNSDRRWARVVAVLVVAGALLFLWVEPPQTPQELLINLSLTFLAALGVAVILSDTPLRERLGRALLLTVSVVLTVVILEGFVLAGIINGERIFATPRSDAPWLPQNRADPELLYTRQPSFKLSVAGSRGNIAYYWCLPPGPEASFTLEYDENGFRNDAGLTQADFVVIGDSYVEAVQLPKKDIFTTHLTEKIGRPVANLGLGGYGPQQQLIILKRYGLSLQPRVVFWFFYEGNDLVDALRYERQTAGGPSVKESLSSLRQHSIVRNAVKKLHSFWCQPHAKANRRYGILDTSENKIVRMYFFDKKWHLESQQDYALNILAQTLDKARELVRRSGAELVVVFVPTKYRAYRDAVHFPKDSEITALEYIDPDLPGRVEKIVKNLSTEISYLDLTPHIKRRIAAGSPILYFLDDTHWAREGHRLVAESLHLFLVKKDILAQHIRLN